MSERNASSAFVTGKKTLLNRPTTPSFDSGFCTFCCVTVFALLSREEVGSRVGSVHSGCADRMASGSSHSLSVSLYTNTPFCGVDGQYIS